MIAGEPISGSIAERVETYHKIARSCAAYAMFYGAMAGQELLQLKARVGARKFLPALKESLPWLAESTAYLYLGYAKDFAARIAAIAPTIGAIDIKTLPDPRDHEAAEKSELFAEVRKNTNVSNAEQMWLALGLMKERRERGGDTSHFPHVPPTQEELVSALQEDCKALGRLLQVNTKTPKYRVLANDAEREGLRDLARGLAEEIDAWLKLPKKQRPPVGDVKQFFPELQ